jgi:hypothetical protein
MLHRFILLMLAALSLGSVTACNNFAEAQRNAADSSKQVVYETKSKWRDLFTYTPPAATPMPQTRYCYRTQSDTVCYDSPQPDMTSKLVGYQDGANISAYQPGGGSLGVSGGEPTAHYQTNEVQQAPPQRIDLTGGQVDVNTDPMLVGAQASSAPMMAGSAAGPFYAGESPYVKGAVTSTALPPAAPAAPATR